MKTKVLIIRGKRMEVSYQENNRGIMLSYVGTKNIVDELTKDERNEIIIHLLTK
jgi:hypothetical protein